MEPGSSTSSSLLAKLRDLGDADSWGRFVETYWRLIFQTARKAGLSDEDAEDVVQETFAAVAANMPDFEYSRKRGQFRSWLLNITHRRITDHLRKQGRRVRTVAREAKEEGTDLLERLPDPESLAWQEAWEDEWRANLMGAAIERAKENVSEQQYQIFHSYVVDGLPAAQVSAALGVSLASVYLAKHRVGRVIRREFERLERREERL